MNKPLIPASLNVPDTNGNKSYIQCAVVAMILAIHVLVMTLTIRRIDDFLDLMLLINCLPKICPTNK